MTAILIPKWSFIVFLTVVYVISALLHLDPAITNAGGGAAITAFTVTPTDFGAFVIVLILALAAAALLGIVSKWAGAAAFVGAMSAGIFITGTSAILGFLVSVVTFSDLGLPAWLQFLIAVPCILLLTWTVLAFVSAIFSIGANTTGGG